MAYKRVQFNANIKNVYWQVLTKDFEQNGIKIEVKKEEVSPTIEARNDDNTARQDLNSNTNMTIVKRAIASAEKQDKPKTWESESWRW